MCIVFLFLVLLHFVLEKAFRFAKLKTILRQKQSKLLSNLNIFLAPRKTGKWWIQYTYPRARRAEEKFCISFFCFFFWWKWENECGVWTETKKKFPIPYSAKSGPVCNITPPNRSTNKISTRKKPLQIHKKNFNRPWLGIHFVYEGFYYYLVGKW